MSMFRELILGNNPSTGEEFSNFDGEVIFDSCSEESERRILAFIEKAKNNDVFLEDCVCDVDAILYDKLEEAWDSMGSETEVVRNCLESCLGYRIWIKVDEVGYCFRIVNEVGAKTWGVLKIN